MEGIAGGGEGRAARLLRGGPAARSLPTYVSPSPSHPTLSTPVKFKTILIKAPQPKLAGASGSRKGKGQLNHPSKFTPPSLGESHRRERCKMPLERRVRTGSFKDQNKPRRSAEAGSGCLSGQAMGKHQRRARRGSRAGSWSSPQSRGAGPSTGRFWLAGVTAAALPAPAAAQSCDAPPPSTLKPGEGRGSPTAAPLHAMVLHKAGKPKPQALSPRRNASGCLERAGRAASCARCCRGAERWALNLFLPQGMGRGKAAIATPRHVPITTLQQTWGPAGPSLQIPLSRPTAMLAHRPGSWQSFAPSKRPPRQRVVNVPSSAGGSGPSWQPPVPTGNVTERGSREVLAHRPWHPAESRAVRRVLGAAAPRKGLHGELLLRPRSAGTQRSPSTPLHQQSRPKNQGSHSSASPAPWSKGDHWVQGAARKCLGSGRKQKLIEGSLSPRCCPVSKHGRFGRALGQVEGMQTDPADPA